MRRVCFYLSIAALTALVVWLTFTGRLQNYLLVSWTVAFAALALFLRSMSAAVPPCRI